MRLWHYKLIPVLPNAMLVSQWRECIAIKRQWEKGTLKHRLVSYVMDYDTDLFNKYVSLICWEMEDRKIKTHKFSTTKLQILVSEEVCRTLKFDILNL